MSLNLLTLAADAPGSGGVAFDLLKLLAMACVVTLILRRFRMPIIPCYLITGALIGPSVLGLIASDANVSSISQLAMVMLMFTIGLHLDPESIGSGMIKTLMVGVVSTLGVAALLTIPAVGFGTSWATGLALGMALSMSSTAVVLQLLQTNREMQRIHGRICVGVSITQDLLSLVFLALFPLIAKYGGPAANINGVTVGAGATADILPTNHNPGMLPTEWPPSLRAVAGIIGIAALIVIGRRALPWVLKEASRSRAPELMLVTAAAAAMGAAVFAAGLGFSAELGAFLAGFLLAGTQFRSQLSGQLAPMRDLFMAVFFTAVGLKLDVGVLASQWWVVLIGLITVVGLKTLLIGGCAWAFGATAPVAVLSGLTLSQAGEFTIVVLLAAAAAGLVPKDTENVAIAIVVLSLIATPGLYAAGKALAPWAARIPPARWNRSAALRERGQEPTAVSRSTPPGATASDETVILHAGDGHGQHVPMASAPAGGAAPQRLANYAVIAGFGVVGRALADRLDVAGIPFCVVDMNRATVDTQLKLGRRSVFGDITNIEVLEAAGIEHADAVFLTIPDDEATLRACSVVRNVRPDIFIAARTSFLSKAFAAQALGADHVVVEEVATAEMMAREVLDRLAKRLAKS